MNTKRFAQTLVIGSALACASQNLAADMIVGEHVVAPYDQAQATVEFLGSEAGYTGQFSYLGWGDEQSVISPGPPAHSNGSGMVLFNNHAATVGDSVLLPDVYSAGDVLHFAYRVIAPNHGQDLFRTDESDDVDQFAFDPQSGAFGVEDLRLPNSDEDYNDASFQVSFNQVPGPGALAAFAVAIALTRRRRRDESRTRESVK